MLGWQDGESDHDLSFFLLHYQETAHRRCSQLLNVAETHVHGPGPKGSNALQRVLIPLEEFFFSLPRCCESLHTFPSFILLTSGQGHLCCLCQKSHWDFLHTGRNRFSIFVRVVFEVIWNTLSEFVSETSLCNKLFMSFLFWKWWLHHYVMKCSFSISFGPGGRGKWVQEKNEHTLHTLFCSVLFGGVFQKPSCSKCSKLQYAVTKKNT